ncbi:MAG TPA: nitroreductase family protein [Candidatus Nanoarchaeia archaeon]|nr:nitroreductase family protein [Candidatus Nanoarchaeia archaeon]
MDVFEAIVKRRSIKKYKRKDIPFDNVATCVHAARFAPCAGNIFNLRFLVIKSESQRKAISEACMEQYWMQDAPIHLVVVSETQKTEQYYGLRGGRVYTLHNAAAACENVLLAATSLGLGSCWVGAFNEDKIKDICNVPPHLDVQMIITLGYADEHPAMPPKRTLEDTLNFGNWYGRIEPPKTGIGDWAPYVEHIVDETKKAVKHHTKKASDKIKETFGKKKKENGHHPKR